MGINLIQNDSHLKIKALYTQITVKLFRALGGSIKHMLMRITRHDILKCVATEKTDLD